MRKRKKGTEKQIVKQFAESKIVNERGDSTERAMFTAAKSQHTIVQLQEQFFCCFLCSCSEQKAGTMLIHTLPLMHI